MKNLRVQRILMTEAIVSITQRSHFIGEFLAIKEHREVF